MAKNKPPALLKVKLIWIEKRIQYWLRFGEPCTEKIIDRRRKTVSFAPGDVFALVRWKSNDYGTVFSAIDILRATHEQGDAHDIRSVKGAAHSLLSIKTWTKVKQVFEHIDAIEALKIRPDLVCPDHWRHVHARIMAGDEPRAYTLERHHIWLSRQEYLS